MGRRGAAWSRTPSWHALTGRLHRDATSQNRIEMGKEGIAGVCRTLKRAMAPEIAAESCNVVSDLPCNVRREGG